MKHPFRLAMSVLGLTLGAGVAQAQQVIPVSSDTSDALAYYLNGQLFDLAEIGEAANPEAAISVGPAFNGDFTKWITAAVALTEPGAPTAVSDLVLRVDLYPNFDRPTIVMVSDPSPLFGQVMSALGTLQITPTFLPETGEWQDLTGPLHLALSNYQVSALSDLAEVPESDTYAMMLAGLGLLGFVAQRRRRF